MQGRVLYQALCRVPQRAFPKVAGAHETLPAGGYIRRKGRCWYERAACLSKRWNVARAVAGGRERQAVEAQLFAKSP